ncbi:hypothetical protein ACFOWX_07435 [Sphingorhabdus arenilitoris]|uniref:UrcA family protein n=1 Tax=Sphingorhabdus arenilitoris TaxID=1490041 RepID=A0ABV8RFQ8_9SPHN
MSLRLVLPAALCAVVVTLPHAALATLPPLAQDIDRVWVSRATNERTAFRQSVRQFYDATEEACAPTPIAAHAARKAETLVKFRGLMTDLANTPLWLDAEIAEAGSRVAWEQLRATIDCAAASGTATDQEITYSIYRMDQADAALVRVQDMAKAALEKAK